MSAAVKKYSNFFVRVRMIAFYNTLPISVMIGTVLSNLGCRRNLELKDFDSFIKVLQKGVDVNQRTEGMSYSVFELACKTPGKKNFIQTCLKRGALVTEKNPETNEYPIHLAARSFDSDNLSQLLEIQGIYVDQKFEDRTALYLLFDQIDSNNWSKVFKCIKLLLEKRANINATDENSVSPIALLVTRGNEDWRKEILEYCLQNYCVNVDFRGKQARKAIEKHFRGTVIPNIDMEKVTVEVLRNKLAAGTEDDFLTAYEKYIQQSEGHVLREEDCAELLSVAVYRAKLPAAQKLIEGQIVDGKFVGKTSLLSGLLAKCCNGGNVPMLEWLLKIIPDHAVAVINEDPLLSLLVKQIDVYKDKNKCPFFKSMGILLNDPRMEIDKIDVKKYTAMHYAVKYKINHAQELLLAKGAYIGGEDLFGESSISEMDSYLLEKHLDSCVTSNDCEPSDNDYKMIIDYSNFVPPGQVTSNDEMRPIVQIAQTDNKKHLLWHPVISSILLLKWLNLIRLIFMNLLLSCIFTFSITTYIVFYFGQDHTPSIYVWIFYYVATFGWLYITGRESILFLLNRRVYVRTLENLIELLLIIASGVVLFCGSSDGIYSYIAIGTILLLGLEFTMQVGMLPVDSISTNMITLKTVSVNFLKCLAMNSILLLSFAFGFYTVFRIAGVNGHIDNDAERFNQFREMKLAVLKTVVMLTGEFDAASIQYDTSGIIYILFFLFVFLVAIVINNLMSALAVSDTMAIQSESEIIAITKMVFVICRHENTIKALNSCQYIAKYLSWLIPSNSLQLFPSREPIKEIALRMSPFIKMEYKTQSMVKRNIETVENGPEREQLLENQDLNKWYYTQSTNNFFFKFFDVMLDKIVKTSTQILRSRQKDIDPIAPYQSQLEELITIVTELTQQNMELKSEIQSLKLSLQVPRNEINT